jgi:NADH-quinone oxidoreductase subunit N
MEFTYTPTVTDWLRFSPELVMAATALVVLLADLMLPAARRAWLALVALIGVAGAAVAVGWLYATANTGPAFFQMISSDLTALFADMLVLVACGLAVLLSPGYIERQGVTQQGEYYALLVLAAGGMMLMASAINLMTIFVGLELLSLCLYILSAYIARRYTSQEAGMKYFLLSSFASGFLLYGMALTYGATGATSLEGIRAFLDAHAFSLTGGFGPLLASGFALMAVGFCFKVSGVPFHFWTPDVYVGAPTSVTAFMSVATKVAAFVALARTYLFALQPVHRDWEPIFWGVAVLSMIGGNLLAVTQTDVKRLLAYSSVAQAGYLLIGIAVATRLGFSAVLVYLTAYTTMNLGAFGVVLVLERREGQGTALGDYAGLAGRRPWLAGVMAICLLSLAGIPPLAGFFGKFAVFQAAIVGGHLELAIVGVLTSMVGVYYYLRVIWAMYFMESPVVTARAMPTSSAMAGVSASGAALGVGGATARRQTGATALALSPAATALEGAVDAQEEAATASPARAATPTVPLPAGLALAIAGGLTLLLALAAGPLFDFAVRAADAAIH